jgi:hypothetical protein
LKWKNQANNQQGFYVYRNLTGTGPALGDRIATIATTTASGNTVAYTYQPPVSGQNYFYWVSAYNAGGESAPLSFPANPYSDTSCTGNLTTSDKYIIAINGASINGGVGTCGNGTDPLPAGATLKLGDTLTFSLNLCNSGASSASNIFVTDSMINLVEPGSGWNAKFNGGSPLTQVADCRTPAQLSNNQYSACGNPPNQSIIFDLSGSSVISNGVGYLTYNGVTAVPTGFSGTTARMQNSFSAVFSGGSLLNVSTPLLQFFTGSGVPTINEVP